jgi:outer membrane lipoprotein-sorting protein
MRVYYPKINTVQVFEVSKSADPVKFVLIGFGISGTELARDYDVSVLPNDGAVPNSVHLQLLPKLADAKQYVTKVELWIPEQGGPYPQREKITQPSNDYRLVMYSDLKINPVLKNDALQLKTAPGVITEHPGK